MANDKLILADNCYYSLDCKETQLNNNVLVVGSPGSGKTRSIVTPNLLECSGSYILSDPKGTLYAQYKDYLEEQGYKVRQLNFVNTEESIHYNFFDYIRNDQDIVKIANIIMRGNNYGFTKNIDPFWDEAGQLLMQALIAYLHEFRPKCEQNLSCVLKLLDAIDVSDDGNTGPCGRIFKEVEKRAPRSFAAKCYRRFSVAAEKTLRSIVISTTAKMTACMTPEIEGLTCFDETDIRSIGDEKTAFFVIVSDTDRSQDGLVNIFFTQAMNELVLHADEDCPNNSLPVPVRFILDDFATNCRIENFPKMIASIRSRGISTMIMIQAEAQLKSGYGPEAGTIIGSCDTYIYLGGNDLDTADSVAKRSDQPIKKILNMPIGTNWIFRRGEMPKNATNFKLEPYLKDKGICR